MKKKLKLIFGQGTEHAQKINFSITDTRCLKITEKVSFNIASEASLHFKWTKVD